MVFIMKKKYVRVIGLIILLLFIIIQFFRIDRTIPASDPAMDFIVSTNPPRRITAIIKSSCYDCHSYKTNYPWYSHVAPVSWLINSHINEAREHLNFSEYGKLSREDENHTLIEIKEVIENDVMPLKSYTLLHKAARLNVEKKKALIKWLTTGKNNIQSQ